MEGAEGKEKTCVKKTVGYLLGPASRLIIDFFLFVGTEKGHKGRDPGDTESPELIRVKVCQESKA